MLAAAPARAEVEPIAIQYEVKGACPSEAEFVEAVRGYTTRWSLVPEGISAKRKMRVRVTARGQSSVGSLAIANASGVIAEREIVGPTCTEVAQALAVMVAVAIDPRAGTPPGAEPKVEDQGEPAPKASSDPLPEAPAQGARRTPRRPRRSTSEAPRVSFDLRIETTSAVVRGSLPGVGLSMTLEPSSTTGSAFLRTWKPSLGIGIRQSLPKERDFRGGSVDIVWTAGNLRLCPFQLSLGSRVAMSPCAETNIGALRVLSEGFADARSGASFWFDLGGSVWATANLTRQLYLSSTVLATLPLERQPFTLAGGAPVASVPPFGILGGIGLGARM